MWSMHLQRLGLHSSSPKSHADSLPRGMLQTAGLSLKLSSTSSLEAQPKT